MGLRADARPRSSSTACPTRGCATPAASTTWPSWSTSPSGAGASPARTCCRAFAPLGIDAFGIDGDLLPAALGDQPGVAFAGNLKPPQLRDALVERRAYLHLNRWTSLGLSLIEAMLLGLPVVVLDTTAAARTVPPGAGAISPDPAVLVAAARRLLADPDEARARGLVAREAALARHGIDAVPRRLGPRVRRGGRRVVIRCAPRQRPDGP